MNTLISIVNEPRDLASRQSGFGSKLSEMTGIPTFNLDKYRVKNAVFIHTPDEDNSNCEQNAVNHLLTNISKKDVAILDHTSLTDMRQINAVFNQKIIILSEGPKNKLLMHRYRASKRPEAKKSADQTSVDAETRYRVQLLKDQNVHFVFGTWEFTPENLMSQIKSILKMDK